MKKIDKNLKNQEIYGYNGLKWAFVLILLLAAVVLNVYYSSLAVALRAVGWIFVFLVAAAVVSVTNTGFRFRQFVKSARVELRKVVWPTRRETIQTTFIVVVFVVIASLILWGVDTLFFSLVGWLIGQRG